MLLHVVTIVGIVSIIFLIRAGLIILGYYKQPILRSFEHYGEEKPYFPLISLVVWAVVLFLCVWYTISVYVNSPTMQFLGFPLIMLGYELYRKVLRFAANHPDHFMMYPDWYQDLCHRTSREERRRVAYLWMRLPYGMRLRYNTHDRAFRQWVDLVLVSVDV